MRPGFRVAAAATLLFLTAPGLGAQQPRAADGDTAQVVSAPEKSPVVAGVLEWVVPTVGYAYAGNWLRGVPPALVRIAGLALVFEQQFVIFGEPPPCTGQCVLGTAMMIGGTVWAIIDAARTATRENERRRTAPLGATLVPTYGAAGVGLGVSVPVGR